VVLMAVLALCGAMLASTQSTANAQLDRAPLTMELDFGHLPVGEIPRDGLAFNSFLTISSIDEDAQLLDLPQVGDVPFERGIALYPGAVMFRFDVERVHVHSFSYEVFNNNASSIAGATGTNGSDGHIHPDGQSSQHFEGLGGIIAIDIIGDESSIENIVIEFTTSGQDEDSDGDGIQDGRDNCVVAFNAEQIDTDGDGFGNACDADLNNDNIINFLDLGRFRNAFGADGEAPEADFNGDGAVDLLDLEVMKAGFFGAPGPSALAR